ncbi:exosome complex protein Rrp42 [Ignicoccus hospitalis]|uniref:Exosome complex component Rrp42 n=1 Tax=Ignicoccus hospitalis (strain KIN4/I / DSM 18386 / JCM 14125) TaxID=453591 RepID=A8A8Z1_IGNH4|nr:exosome complex protein Rrp42 [Ignicoccus hospitalis]ABU81393.1 ribosomal RNA-processing protein RRP42 [Ignicoccus hospitalis KIN4/I]HIH90299.1 exosome complex protein Rrp42 [Desulfurococcaceae archaeon]
MSITPFNVPIVPKLKRDTILSLAKRGTRIDKRRLDQYRPIKITLGVGGKAHGSALVEIGNTKVLAGVKVEVGKPFKDVPDAGVLNVNAELLPLASSEFEPGPPDENAIELARVIDRALREPGVIDLKELVLIPGEKVLVVWLDVYVLDHDGNLFDASMLASMAALLDTRYPEYVVREDGSVEVDEANKRPLPIANKVVSVTLNVLENLFMVDPTLEEEVVADGKIVFAFDERGRLVGLQKSGPAWLDLDKSTTAFNLAYSKYKELLEVLEKSLAER